MTLSISITNMSVGTIAIAHDQIVFYEYVHLDYVF